MDKYQEQPHLLDPHLGRFQLSYCILLRNYVKFPCCVLYIFSLHLKRSISMGNFYLTDRAVEILPGLLWSVSYFLPAQSGCWNFCWS